MKAGLTREIAEEFARSKPLYEVAFEFMVDPLKGEATCLRAHGIGGGDTLYNLDAMKVFTFTRYDVAGTLTVAVIANNEDTAWELVYNRLSMEGKPRQRDQFKMKSADYEPVFFIHQYED
jgi:hypothetical protein